MRDEERRALLAEVGRRLKRRFGPRKFSLRENPLESLVWTVLTQNTTDLTADRAYRELRRRFPRWERVLAAPRAEVESAIRVCGLARQKARTIQEFLKRLAAYRLPPTAYRLSLAFLRRLPPAEAMAWLTASPGIGTKTAAVVLLFACGQPLFPVDTHIRRVAGRLGLAPEGAPAYKVQEILQPLAPHSAAACAQLHLDLIRLGREICVARGPRCPICPLRNMCRSARRFGPRLTLIATPPL